MKKKNYIKKAISWIQKRPSNEIKSAYDGFEDTKTFTNSKSDQIIQPDFSFTTYKGTRHFTEIALKQEKVSRLVTRWKLLSLYASMKRGKLHLLAPKGHKSFAQKLVSRYNINALVYSLT